MENLFEMESQQITEPLTQQNRRLQKVTLQNYRNVEYKEYVLDGNSILLEGLNGLGKTNVLEGVFWALSGNLFDGTAKTESQDIIPYEADKDAVTSVKLEFEQNSFVFERKVTQKWSRDKETYKGLTTTLLVNNAASKNQDTALSALLNYLGFNNISNNFNLIPDLSKLNLFELVYNANSLRTLDYKIIRSIIIDMVGEVDFKDIINEQHEKYGILVEPLRKHGLDLAALKSNTRSKIFDKTNGLEIKAKNMKATIESYEQDSEKIVSKDDVEKAKDEIKRIDNEIKELEKQKFQSSDDTIRDLNNSITSLKNKIYERQNELRTEYQTKVDTINANSKKQDLIIKKQSLAELKDDRLELNRKIGNKELELERVQSRLTNKKSDLEEANNDLIELKAQWYEINDGKPSGTEYSCPHCGSLFDVSQTKEFKEHAMDELNKKGSKQKQLVLGLEEGIKTLKDDITVKSDAILELQEERNQLDKNLNNLFKDITNLEKELESENIENPVLDLENDKTVLDYRKEILDLENQKKQLVLDNTQHLNDVSIKISDLETEKAPHQQIVNAEITAKSYRDNAKLKKDELSDIQDELQAAYDIITLIKDLEKDMYEKLDKKVGNVFGNNIQFKLYKLNVSNGEYDTRMCDIYVRDIKDRFVNIKTINTGMFPVRATEIISKIKAHYEMPKSFIFIDEMSGLDSQHLQLVKSFGEQIFATKVGEQKTIKETRF